MRFSSRSRHVCFIEMLRFNAKCVSRSFFLSQYFTCNSLKQSTNSESLQPLISAKLCFLLLGELKQKKKEDKNMFPENKNCIKANAYTRFSLPIIVSSLSLPSALPQYTRLEPGRPKLIKNGQNESYWRAGFSFLNKNKYNIKSNDIQEKINTMQKIKDWVWFFTGQCVSSAFLLRCWGKWSSISFLQVLKWCLKHFWHLCYARLQRQTWL